MARIGLMMIVKNEAHVIERCLSSVLPFIDWWVIADTGSTDGTRDVVRRVMANVPGELVERPWVNFGHNRQEVLDLARAAGGTGDYVLWIDADEQLVDVPAQRPHLVADGYDLTVNYSGTRYDRLALIRLDKPWSWLGPVHEYLDLKGASRGSLTAPTVLVQHDGARSRDPETYRKDAALLQAALDADPGNPRLQFYLAQSFYDAGQDEDALTAYRARFDNASGWDQERWYSLHRIAILLERTGASAAEVADAYLAAYQFCTWRAEPLVELARFERQRERYALAAMYASVAAALKDPSAGALFVDVETYAWRRWDELSLGAYWSGDFETALDAAQRALAVRPDDQRLQANLTWCQNAS